LSKTEEKEYLRPSELAKIIGNSTGFIRESALKIPGVCLYQNGYRFKKTAALQKWAKKQRVLVDEGQWQHKSNRVHPLQGSVHMYSINLTRRMSDLRVAIAQFEESFEVADLDNKEVDKLFWELYPISQFAFAVSDELTEREKLPNFKGSLRAVPPIIDAILSA
jgi:hypothetical protein